MTTQRTYTRMIIKLELPDGTNLIVIIILTKYVIFLVFHLQLELKPYFENFHTLRPEI